MTKEKGLAGKIKRLRRAVGMGQEIVARVLEIPRSSVSAIESGQREISAMELLALCQLYRISPNEMLEWKIEQREVDNGHDGGPTNAQ